MPTYKFWFAISGQGGVTLEGADDAEARAKWQTRRWAEASRVEEFELLSVEVVEDE
jgi:hypothetical protein